MQKIKIDLENCYGIRALKAELDFSKKRANIIYAPNGSMKSSLSRTFKDLSEDKDSKDRIYKDRITKRVITDENNADFANESIFVIESFVPTYESQRISTLLVNKELKDEYDGILSSINGKKENLLRELKESSGLKNNIEEIISVTFTKEKEKFLVALGRVEAEVLDEDESELASVLYDQIFNDKVENFLNTKDFKTKLLEYTAIYDLVK